ncbi:MAG: Fic family protein [Eubacterium sp.]|nr:Fic family protein [Eubacterium sp.]
MIADRFNMTIEDNIFTAKRLLVDSVYQQANLEGIAVTYAQTQDILNNVNVSNLSPKDISKVCCLRDGWKYFFDNLNEPLDLIYLKELHEIVARFDVDYRYLGKIRTNQVLISGTTWKPGLPDEDKLFHYLDSIEYIDGCITNTALKTGLKIMRMQPFQDGNKRIGSFVINKILVSHGRGIFNVPVELDGTFKEKLVRYYESDDPTEFTKWIRETCLFGTNEIITDKPAADRFSPDIVR